MYRFYHWKHTKKEGGILMNQSFSSISTKDSIYFDETMKSLLVLSKKINEYEQTVVDTDLKTNFGQIKNSINTQYHQLLEVLNNG